jgi:peptidoglycan/LPS O-acetylase OafA/YrhL
MKHLAPFIVMIAILIAISVIIVVMTNYDLKKKILNKENIDDKLYQILGDLTGFGSEMLKWGIILLFGGIGLIVLEFLPYGENSPLPYGVMTVFVSLGFLTYYFLMKNQKK